MYHMYETEDPGHIEIREKEKLLEGLFLKACVPVMKRTMPKTFRCEGCSKMWLSQLEHECLYPQQPHCKDYALVPRAAAYMVNKAEKVFAEMRRIIEASPTGEYASLTLSDFLKFFSDELENYPMKRLCWDTYWHSTIFRMIKESEEGEMDEDDEEERNSPPAVLSQDLSWS